jgi:hypothetical protein
MTAALSADVLQDELAVSLARVLAAANKDAPESGVDVLQGLITVTQIHNGDVCWRIKDGPKDYIGRRGGDLIIEVETNDASIKQVLHGQ